MSLTLNMVGGGGGGLSATDALLRVQAPANSTVTITKGTTTKTDMGHENADDNSVYDYYFIIHQSQFDSVNPWTVTATDGVDSATKTIVINAADEYDLAFYAFLPSEYTPVEYIESTGTQHLYIDFGSNKNLNALKYVVDIQIPTGGTSGECFIGDTQTSPYFAFLRYWSGNFYPTLNSDGTPVSEIDNSLLNHRHIYTYDGSNGTVNIYHDNTLWYSGTRGVRNRQTLIFLSYYNGTNLYKLTAKTYGFKVYDADHTSLLLDCYPCYRNSDNVAGFYNKANGDFLTNQGTGTFIVGSDL